MFFSTTGMFHIVLWFFNIPRFVGQRRSIFVAEIIIFLHLFSSNSTVRLLNPLVAWSNPASWRRREIPQSNTVKYIYIYIMVEHAQISKNVVEILVIYSSLPIDFLHYRRSSRRPRRPCSGCAQLTCL